MELGYTGVAGKEVAWARILLLFLSWESGPESRELFYLVGIFRTLSLGDSILVTLRKLLQGGRRGSQAIYKFATKGAGSLNFKDQVSS